MNFERGCRKNGPHSGVSKCSEDFLLSKYFYGTLHILWVGGGGAVVF